jgi:hypothetical protein
LQVLAKKLGMTLTRRVVKDWALGRNIPVASSGYTPNGTGRRFASVLQADGWAEAFDAFGLNPTIVEPIYKNFTGHHYADGARTGAHTDEAPEGFTHVRCNVLVKLPLQGGLPFINGEILPVELNDLWLCLASEESHGSTPIAGGDRVIFSYGALVPKSVILGVFT